MAIEGRRLPRLPACKHCSTKKVKCDSSRPKCLSCARTGLDCIMFDSAGQRWVSREYIDHLEKQERDLSNRAPSVSQANGSDHHVSPVLASPDNINTHRSVGSSTTISRGAGMSFISLLFSDVEWRRSNAHLLKSLTHAHRPPDTSIEPCPLPPSHVVEKLFEQYLSRSHVFHPILLRQEVWDLHRRLFPSAGEAAPADSHDLFRAFIICAIASVIPHRTGAHSQHPGGYYRAALHNIGPYLLTRGLESMQDLLLIGRFGVYHHIGISIWELAQLCGRLCTELGLHCGDTETGNLLQDQKTRRVFWYFYLIDRYSSITLDRPFAIDDASIEIGLPVDADDNDLAAASPSFHSLDAFSQGHAPTRQTEVTVFLFCVRLRQLSSRINAELSNFRTDPSLHTQPYLAVGRICTTLDRLLQELDAWHDSAPVIPNPKCLYESLEWFRLLASREKIDLVRRAVDIIPKTNGAPPKHVVALFLRTALQVIHNYSTLFERTALISYTRNYFHMMFTAGLSVMYCTSVSQALDHADLLGISQGLRTCEATLVKMSEQLSDARSYAAVFGALHRHISRKIQRAMGTAVAQGAEASTGQQNDGMFGSESLNSAQTTGFTQSHMIPGHVQGSHGFSNDISAQPVSGLGFGTHSEGFDAAANSFGALGVPGTGVDSDAYHWSTEGFGAADEDFLQRAFLHDETVWNMDMMLGEYVYGDVIHSGLLDGVNI